MRPLLGIFGGLICVPLRLFLHLWMMLQEAPKWKMMQAASVGEKMSMLETAAKVGCSCCPSSCQAGNILRLFGQSIHQLLERWDFHFEILEKHCEVPWSFLSGKGFLEWNVRESSLARKWTSSATSSPLVSGFTDCGSTLDFHRIFFSSTELNFVTFRPVSRHLDRCWLCFFGPSGWSPASERRSSSRGAKVFKKWTALNSPISIWTPGLACLVSTSADTVNCINATEETHLWCVPGDQVWSC